MTISARCIRRFQIKANGLATIECVTKTIELPELPSLHTVLDFGDGLAPVTTIVMQPMGASPPAVSPPRIQLRTKTEPGDRLARALEAGWDPLAAEEPEEPA